MKYPTALALLVCMFVLGAGMSRAQSVVATPTPSPGPFYAAPRVSNDAIFSPLPVPARTALPQTPAPVMTVRPMVAPVVPITRNVTAARRMPEPELRLSGRPDPVYLTKSTNSVVGTISVKSKHFGHAIVFTKALISLLPDDAYDRGMIGRFVDYLKHPKTIKQPVFDNRRDVYIIPTRSDAHGYFHYRRLPAAPYVLVAFLSYDSAEQHLAGSLVRAGAEVSPAPHCHEYIAARSRRFTFTPADSKVLIAGLKAMVDLSSCAPGT